MRAKKFSCAGGVCCAAALLACVGMARATGLPVSERMRVDAGAMVSIVDPMGTDGPVDGSTRSPLLLRLRYSPMCYASDLTPSQLQALIDQTDLLPPAMGQLSDRYYTDTFVWNGDGGTGPSARAQRAMLTYSFPADGTTWGMSPTSRVAPSDLSANLISTFGDLDKGREYLRSSLAAWRKYCGITYTEVDDDNTLMTGSSTRVSTRGDIRIGGFQFVTSGPNGILAYNGFPTSLGASSVSGGDMAINTSYFIASWFQSNFQDYRRLRNTVAHEHGHGLACIHSIPCDATKLMEPTIVATFDMLQRDEIRAGQRNYGDRLAGNQTFATAKNVGNLTTPAVRSVIYRDLSTNGRSGYAFTGEDWFKFTIDSTQNITISATPTGESSSQGQQIGSCTGTEAIVDSLNAGALRMELRDSLNAVIQGTPAQGAGVPATLSLPSLAPGTYAVRVYDDGPNLAANQILQTYDLVVRTGTSLAPPDPIAGINKRVQAGTNAWFNGSINSRATEPGATLAAAGFDWDLDGDGVIDATDNPQPSFIYPSNGNYNATLFLTDSNGQTGTDTITVTAFGAATNIASLSPPSVSPGAGSAVTIYGTNFKGVTSASQVVVSGTGVTVTGTPVVNNLGTQITGLNFAVAAGAFSGPRDVTITNSDGLGTSGTGVGAFTVGPPPGPPANDECTGAVSWGNALGPQAFSNVGATRSSSQIFTNTGCPASGPIENDVWYSWTAPASGTLTVTTDSASVGFATRVALYRINAGCPPTSGAFRCDDFGAPFSLAVSAGTLFRFQVGSVTAGATGTAHVILSLAANQGSCCMPSGACSVTSDTGCVGGDWFFAGVCSPNTCPQPSGACCASGNCSLTTSPNCTAILGTWKGVGTVCGDATNPIACCPANFNRVGGVTLQDVFDYLTAWFNNDATADFNGTAGVTLQDLFDFLGAWFQGC